MKLQKCFVDDICSWCMMVMLIVFFFFFFEYLNLCHELPLIIMAGRWQSFRPLHLEKSLPISKFSCIRRIFTKQIHYDKYVGELEYRFREKCMMRVGEKLPETGSALKKNLHQIMVLGVLGKYNYTKTPANLLMHSLKLIHRFTQSSVQNSP